MRTLVTTIEINIVNTSGASTIITGVFDNNPKGLDISNNNLHLYNNPGCNDYNGTPGTVFTEFFKGKISYYIKHLTKAFDPPI